jgi:phage N-6-adenine-methyltransferase
MQRSDPGGCRRKPTSRLTRCEKTGRAKLDLAARKNLAVHFSSKTSTWETPRDLFEKLDLEFGFTLDVCALPENAKCMRFFTPEDDGLEKEWEGVCWMNPPYGREIGQWVKKAHQSALNGATVVCLLPARTDTQWWHTFVMGANEIRFLRGRLRFVGAKSCAPFPSVVVVFRPWGSETMLRRAA